MIHSYIRTFVHTYVRRYIRTYAKHQTTTSPHLQTLPKPFPDFHQHCHVTFRHSTIFQISVFAFVFVPDAVFVLGFVWSSDLVFRFGIPIWYPDLVFRSGIPVGYSDCVFRFGIPVWCIDLLFVMCQYRPAFEISCSTIPTTPWNNKCGPAPPTS